MRVIKHGNMYELGSVTCNKCNCIFAITLKDVKLEHYTDYGSYDRDEYDTHITNCPECNNKIEVNLKEFKI